MLSFRAIAESWRVLRKARNRPTIIANNLLADPQRQWPVVFLFYPPVKEKGRLTDEDFRELFFLLTDAYPEEVLENPDLINLLCELSETQITDVSAFSAYTRIVQILDSTDNNIKARLLYPMFSRLNKRDMRVFLQRLSVRGGPVRRRDIISALTAANDERFHHIRSAVNLLGLERTTHLLEHGIFEYEAIRPRVGLPIILPSPTYVTSVDSVPFGKCYVEEIEGAWVTVHKSEELGVVGYTASGEELPDDDSSIEAWALAVGLPDGIFLSDYAEMRETPLMVIDCLTPKNAADSLTTRREYLATHVSDWGLKKLVAIDDPLSVIEITGGKRPVIIRNRRSILTYENTIEEVIMVRIEKKPRVFRVTGGRVVQPTTGAPPYVTWSISARDGVSDYYRLGELSDVDAETQRFIKRHIEDGWKMIEGENLAVTIPCFVEVAIDACGWGDYGPFISGRIIRGSPTSGISDVVGVEEI